MSAITSAISHLFQAIFDLIRGGINTVIWAIQSVISLVVSVISSIIDFFGGVVSFLFANIITIGIIVAAVYGWQEYQKRQGNTVGVKKMQ